MINPVDADEARAQSVVAAMAALVDLQDWLGLQNCFSGEVTIDYSSLWGGDSQRLSSGELIALWKAILPGFDATRHQLGPIQVGIEGDTATACADVIGYHFLNAQAWIVSGSYQCDLVRAGTWWAISALTFILSDETGDRQLVEQARARSGARE